MKACLTVTGHKSHHLIIIQIEEIMRKA